MNLFKEQIKIEQKRIQRLIDLTGIPERQADMGSLHLEMRGKSICCFEQKYDHGKRISKKYLGSKNTPRVKQLVAIRVAEERLRHLEYNQNLLKKLETRYMDYDMEAILKDLPKAYRMAAIQETFDEQYEKVRKWANGDWKRNTAPFSDAATFAKDGTHVRSKGECLYYNMLLEHGLLFVYDCYMTFTNRLGEKRQFYGY